MAKRKQTRENKKTTRSLRAKQSRATKLQKATFLQRQRARFLSIKWTESYSSFLLGVVVVIIAVLFGATLLRQQHPVQQTSSLETGPLPSATVSPTPGSTSVENGKTYYTVKVNDSLWDIAQTYYKDGFQWTKIAQANNIASPSTIFTGNKLLLPDVAANAATLGQLTPGSQSNAITGMSYTVQKDDSLWDIAVRAYADGYQWTKIAQANHLDNPDLIFSGNVLQIPR